MTEKYHINRRGFLKTAGAVQLYGVVVGRSPKARAATAFLVPCYCAACHFPMDCEAERIGDPLYVECRNPGCANHGRRFEVPTVELKELAE